ncbi:MAG: hypothetical protein F4X76_03445 [Chloroflexi bacterium]|nr:hypothetical protein [Chloroflexota bacterium]
MGTFNVTVEVAAGPDGPFESMEAMVDTGATFTVAPASTLHRLGVEPTRRIRFALADGSRVERDAGWMVIRVGGIESPSPVVFGEDDGGLVLGSVTLTTLGLHADLVRQQLVPALACLPGIVLAPDREAA